MKAERRHELKTNTLATKLVSIPDTGRKFAGRLLMACILVAALSFVIVNYWSTSVTTKERMLQDLSSLQENIHQLNKPMDISGNWQINPASISETGKDIASSLREITDKASDPRILAQAWLLRGDLSWTLANVYYLRSGIPTRSEPGAKPYLERDTLLSDATEAYHHVVEHFSDDPQAVLTAQFGLAAIAEDKADVTQNFNDWIEAQQLYQTILKNPKADSTAKAQAQYRLGLLSELSKPILLGRPQQPLEPATTTRSTQPTTESGESGGFWNDLMGPATTQSAATGSGAKHPTTLPAMARPSTPGDTTPSTPEPIPDKGNFAGSAPSATAPAATRPAPAPASRP